MATRLFLLPGLAADERMFSFLGPFPFLLKTPRLFDPLPHETMPSYAARVADGLELAAGDYLGGSSFGSLVATEIARQRSVQGLVLIGGALSSAQLVPAARHLERFGSRVPFRLLRRILASDFFLRQVFGPESPERLNLGRQMLLDTSRNMLLYGGRLAVSYFPESSLRIPVAAIHGGCDRVMTPPPCTNLCIIPDAGHGLAVSHPEAVTRFIRTFVK